MALLEVKHLHTYFKTRKGTVKAVNDVSYSLEEGKTIGIVGESGSGKSVSAMSILQLLDGNGYIDSGEIIFEENDLTKIKREELYKIIGKEKITDQKVRIDKYAHLYVLQDDLLRSAPRSHHIHTGIL